MPQIESLLSARLFLAPQVVGERLYFISNLSGRLSLYVMDMAGSMPEPLLPPQIAMQNPDLLDGHAFTVFPKLGTILVMLDRDGDERYQPMLIPVDGGFPEPAFADRLAHYRVHLGDCDIETNCVYLNAEAQQESIHEAYLGRLETGELLKLGASTWGCAVAGANANHTRAILADGYTSGDTVLYQWTRGTGERQLLYGTPLEQRAEGEHVPLTSFGSCFFTGRDRGVLCVSGLFSDSYGLAYFPLDHPQAIAPVTIEGIVHTGSGELVSLEHLTGDLYLVGYNIDGCSWLYEGSFDEEAPRMVLDTVICGQGACANGVLESARYDEAGDRYALSFSTATTPTQLYTIGTDRRRIQAHTRERVLGIPTNWLSVGEDASFDSFDGLRISARLYLPAPVLGFSGPRPLVYYVHGGPQSQERPDFAWFSMPLIQFLTINGFAVFVPNARGSTGYGLSYTKWVDRDWGGQDRLDHVHAMGLLRQDRRLLATRAAVMGRSYGGYMTLTLAARHPELWSAAVDMFGPYDLLHFLDAIPETWKPYFTLALGDPEKDRAFLVERSPRTYIQQIACPLLVIQGKNDPRVIEAESRAVVEQLRASGKRVEYLMFENEGHDVLKFENRVACYNAITAFVSEHLGR